MAERAPRDRDSRRITLAAVPLLVFLALAGIFLKQLTGGDGTQDIPSALIGRQVPEFKLEPLAGLKGPGQEPVPGFGAADLKAWAGNEIVAIVNVWASWCAPCRIEHPLLLELSRDSRVRLYGINYKDDTENALRFLGQLGNPFAAVGVDPAGKAAIDWGVYGVPETFIVGADGVILYKHVGPLSEAAIRDKIGPVLAKAVAKPSS